MLIIFIYLGVFTINLYSKNFQNILECTQNSDCTGMSDTCKDGQCQCGANPGVCRHTSSLFPTMCINGDCVKKPGNENDTELFDKYVKEGNEPKFRQHVF